MRAQAGKKTRQGAGGGGVAWWKSERGGAGRYGEPRLLGGASRLGSLKLLGALCSAWQPGRRRLRSTLVKTYVSLMERERTAYNVSKANDTALYFTHNKRSPQHLCLGG